MKTSVRWNEEQERKHREIKEWLGLTGTYGEDSNTVHISQIIAHNVLHNLLGSELGEVFKKERKRILAEKKLGRPKKPTIVPHPLSDLEDKHADVIVLESSSDVLEKE